MKPERWHRIRQLYEHLVELEPGKREAFLERECAGDESLRAELRSLLEHSGSADRFMELPAIKAAARALAADHPQSDLRGSDFGHYRFMDKIGAGGMGVVYRALDKSLQRQVAVKVLPDIFSREPERLARFEREARLLASLNHAAIGAIYGLEHHEGKRFLVLELVEGETLAQRISRGRIPVDEALAICRQIAEGLEAAHEKGIIHRDLKPANVMVTREGKVKILDFGLAKAFHEEPSGSELANSPTITEAMTHPGVVLGTAAYMSPEQAKGKVADKRADIWAFGCVLFECLTGTRAFGGESISEVMVSVLQAEPNWGLLPPATTPVVVTLLRRCLQKDRNRRQRDIADARIEIEEASTFVPSAEMRKVTSRKLGGRTIALIMAGIAGVSAVIVIGYLAWESEPAGNTPVLFAHVDLAPARQLHTNEFERIWLRGAPSRTAFALSPDGRHLAYSAEGDEGTGLYVRSLGERQGKYVAGTDNAFNPFFSPDGQWIGYWADGKICKVSLSGGLPSTICSTAGVSYPFPPIGIHWTSDARIIWSMDWQGLWQVSAAGGEPQLIARPDTKKGEFGYLSPVLLPDGDSLLFTVRASPVTWPESLIVVQSLSRGTRRTIIKEGSDARYLPTGHLVFARQGKLVAVPFNLKRLEIAGSQVPVIDNLMHAVTSSMLCNTGSSQYGFSKQGALVYAKGGIPAAPTTILHRVDRKGNSKVIQSGVRIRFPRISPDGKHLCWVDYGIIRIVVLDLLTGSIRQLTREGEGWFPTWHPGNGRITFSWCRTGFRSIYWQPADESSPMELLATTDWDPGAASWSPDGRYLSFFQEGPGTLNDVLIYDSASQKILPFLQEPHNEEYPLFSPDAHWLAYASDESGRYEVYLKSFPDGKKMAVSTDGGSEPLWSPDMRELFYRRGPKEVWVAPISQEGGFRVAKPRLLFESKTPFMTNILLRNYDIDLDGMHFLMVEMALSPPAPVTELVYVQNWLEELQRLVPGGR